MRLEIRRLKELEVFNSLRLSMVVATEVLTDVAADVADRTELMETELVGTELVAELVAELEAWAEIRQLEELEILLVAVRC